ncbi:hypothetical protein [Vibrio japonicus]|uniref:Uncharacterized protein n=1 Tax=Vibrio japonicus TaxID=1824638 RepID=A0ABY5LJ78_9VIBR|nr:hypothetical protein [Vibrio japonicus]UUM32113.1 hypothetical protein NP165_17595 [Vibrio japonicus]
MSALNKTTMTVEEKMTNIDSESSSENNSERQNSEIRNGLKVNVFDRKLEQYGRTYNQDFDFD